MKKSLKLFILLLGSGLFASPAAAGLFFCNNSGQEIAVAVAWHQNGTWLSKGWYRIKPRNCSATLVGVLERKRYYYYANSVGGHLSWGGEGENDTGYFCTDNNAFFYRNSIPNNCEGKTFRGVWVGNEQQFTVTLGERKSDPTSAALNCMSTRQDGIDAFTKCWTKEMATNKQLRILDCIDNTRSKASLAICAFNDSMSPDAYKLATCANKYNESRRGDEFLKCAASGTLSEEEAEIFQCAVDNNGSYAAMGSCAISGQLTPEQRQIYSCAANNLDNYVNAGLCAVGTQLTPEQNRIASCVLNNKGSYIQMGVCAAGNDLTPEQQVFANCAVTTGGQPYAFAGCVGTQLTLNELQKCMTHGIGGNGCFGDNNTAVMFVRNAWKDVTEGPGPSNDLLGQDGFIGRKVKDIGSDIQHGAGASNDLVGRDGFVCRTLFGGC